MDSEKLGNKNTCYQCGCKFYDLNRPEPICPKCGADQTQAPKKESTPTQRKTSGIVASRTRGRRPKQDDSIPNEDSVLDDDGGVEDGLEDGLSLVEDDLVDGEDNLADDT